MEFLSHFLLACMFLFKTTAQSEPKYLNLVRKQNRQLLILAMNTVELVSLSLIGLYRPHILVGEAKNLSCPLFFGAKWFSLCMCPVDLKIYISQWKCSPLVLI